MRFTISRTSERGDEVSPCDRAYRGSMTEHTYYTFRTVTEARRRYPHREFEKVDGHIRSVGTPRDCWFVSIDTIDDLMTLYNEVGPIVIEPNMWNHEQPHIEIYDGYRE